MQFKAMVMSSIVEDVISKQLCDASEWTGLVFRTRPAQFCHFAVQPAVSSRPHAHSERPEGDQTDMATLVVQFSKTIQCAFQLCDARGLNGVIVASRTG